jgi:hypothetical protein
MREIEQHCSELAARAGRENAVRVYYVCPACAGPHARADCPSAPQSADAAGNTWGTPACPRLST